MNKRAEIEPKSRQVGEISLVKVKNSSLQSNLWKRYLAWSLAWSTRIVNQKARWSSLVDPRSVQRTCHYLFLVAVVLLRVTNDVNVILLLGYARSAMRQLWRHGSSQLSSCRDSTTATLSPHTPRAPHTCCHLGFPSHRLCTVRVPTLRVSSIRRTCEFVHQGHRSNVKVAAVRKAKTRKVSIWCKGSLVILLNLLLLLYY